MPVFLLDKDLVFPSPDLAGEEGLLAIGGDLSEGRLLLAYRMGVFPWYSEGDPLLWWSPDPRLILLPDEFHVSRRLARVIRQGVFRITMDEAFGRVIRACAESPRADQDGTWITGEMIEAYCRLHAAGYAHSVECWREDELVGGLYGVNLGNCFFGESMFSRTSDASKAALAALVDHVKSWPFALIDCQIATPHLSRMGAREVSRKEFLRLLKRSLRGKTRRCKWTVRREALSTVCRGHSLSNGDKLLTNCGEAMIQ